MRTNFLKTACLILLMLLTIIPNINAKTLQGQVYTGVVHDSENKPLIGVTVAIKGTGHGTTTDADGKFSITSSVSKPTLLFSYIGFEPVEVEPGNKPLIIKMKELDSLLKETVVIGYGSRSKKEITGSIASLKTDYFNKGVFSDAMGLLQGKVAGLSVLKPNGADPLSGYEIILRGTSTLTATQSPLIIIDGVIGGELKNINFEEVESMDILKDGSAAAIYGTRGTNGVIIITTKRAKSGKASVEYNGQFSVQVAPKKVENLNASEFEYAIKNYTTGKESNLYGADTDWFKEITRSTPFSQRHSVALSGGVDQFSHRTILNLEQNEGLLKDNNLKKYLIKTNIIQKGFDDRLILDINATYSVRKYNPANQDLFAQAFINNPTAPVYDATNTYSGGYFMTPGLDYYNPVAMLNERKREGKTADFTGSGRATVKIIDNFTWSNFLSYSSSTWEDRSYKTKYYPSIIGKNGEAEISNGNYENIQYEMLLNYLKNIGKHNFQIIGGYSFQEEISSNSYMINSGYDTDLYGTNNIGMGTGLQKGTASMGSYKEKNNLIAFFGRAMYNYSDKYLASISMRREGSSKFGKNNKWGWFPAISLGWRINNEDFLKDVKLINDLKLRAGYGVTGNQGFSSYKSLVLMGKAGSFYYNGEWINTYQPKSNPEPDLKWEMKHEYNVGVDFSLLNNRLRGTVDVYYRDIKNLLYSYDVSVPPNLYKEKFTNVGEITNVGFEFTINGVPVKTNNLTWTTGLTYSMNKNKLKKLSNSEFSKSYIDLAWIGGTIGVNSQRMQEGKSLGTFYGPVWLGLDENGKDLFKNADPMGKVDPKDWETIGNAYPDCTIGLTNNFDYKDWNLNFSLRSSIGGKVLNTYRLYYENWGTIGLKNVVHTQYETPQFTGAAMYSSKYLEDATFLKLDNVTLGYNIPVKCKSIAKMNVSATAQNVFCITGYKGLDPEVALSGLTPGIEYLSYYPRTTTITLGLNITF